MGYAPFIADLVFMAANSYFATHLSFDRKYAWLHTYVDAIIGYCEGPGGEKVLLPPPSCETPCRTAADCPGNNTCFRPVEEDLRGADREGWCLGDDSNHWVDGIFPFNPRVYLWASQVIKFAPLLTDGIIDRSVYYGRTGIHFCPDNWELYFDVGFNLYFEYRDKTPEEKQALRKEGLDYLSVASLLPNSSVDPNFVAGTLWSKEETERAMRQIYLTYYHATDRQRKEIRSRVRVYGQRELADLFEQDEKTWQEQFSFIPQSLFHLVAAPVVPVPSLSSEATQ